jgi:hypothetical protein
MNNVFTCLLDKRRGNSEHFASVNRSVCDTYVLVIHRINNRLQAPMRYVLIADEEEKIPLVAEK